MTQTVTLTGEHIPALKKFMIFLSPDFGGTFNTGIPDARTLYFKGWHLFQDIKIFSSSPVPEDSNFWAEFKAFLNSQ